MEKKTNWKAWFTIALAVVAVPQILPSLAPMPEAYTAIFDNQLNLGLDLKGGLELKYTVDFKRAIGDNANKLREMQPLWQRRFLTWGILIAVFGMRIVFPLLIVVIAALRGVGDANVTVLEVFVAYSVALLLTTVPLAPGGAGTVDAALIGMLVAFGAEFDQAVAADVIWRAFSFLPQMVLGWLAVGYFTVRQRLTRRSHQSVEPDPDRVT